MVVAPRWRVIIMLISDFQKLIHDRYYPTDSARGAPATFLWFAEEVGELAQAIAERERGDEADDSLEEEFADVLAWLTTLANITGVDLTRAIHRKYITNGGPEGTK
jgi:NTP pyrophosphatase (non-canonical NTP hydrolase)